MQDILEELKCPITLDMIDDPVQTPCCGKSVSRSPLVTIVNMNHRCPLCSSDLSNFDPTSAQPNRVLAAIVESYKKKMEGPTKIKEQDWSATCCFLPNNNSVARLHIGLKNSRFVARKTFFLAVVDNSGSMAGSAWKQVQTALVHILGLTASNMAAVFTRIITYNSIADVLPAMIDASMLNSAVDKVMEVKAGGGTNFLSAYSKISEVINQVIKSSPGEYASVQIAFLTDGQASEQKSTLTAALKEILSQFKSHLRITVHTVGFSGDCDRNLLETMRTAGTEEGAFRYTEPGEGSDALCGKLTTLFTLAERASTAPVTVELRVVEGGSGGSGVETDGGADVGGKGGDGGNSSGSGSGGGVVKVQFADKKGMAGSNVKELFLYTSPFAHTGELDEWIIVSGWDGYASSSSSSSSYSSSSFSSSSSSSSSLSFIPRFQIVINSKEDKNVIVNVQPATKSDFEGFSCASPSSSSSSNSTSPSTPPTSSSSASAGRELQDLWLRRILDSMAEELLQINESMRTSSSSSPSSRQSPLLREIQIGLFESRLKAIRLSGLLDVRIAGLQTQVESLVKGTAVNEGKLADMRFSSLFTPTVPVWISKKADTSSSSSSLADGEYLTDEGEVVPVTKRLPAVEEKPVYYPHNGSGLNRNEIEQLIFDTFPKRLNKTLQEKTAAASDEDLFVHTDKQGNTALHVAAYCGFDLILAIILKRLQANKAKAAGVDSTSSSSSNAAVAGIGGGGEAAVARVVNSTNNDGETPVTLAIKRRGFTDSLALLHGAGGVVEGTRIEPLKRFCIKNGFTRTAIAIDMLATSVPTAVTKLDVSVTPQYAQFQWDSAKSRGVPRYASSWLQVALAHCLVPVVKELVTTPECFQDAENLGTPFVIPWKWFIDYCLPPKPDHPQTNIYLEMTDLLVTAQPSLLSGKDPETGDTNLINATLRGSLPHVEYFVDHDAEVDEENLLGNTALILSCFKRYPCILDYLILKGGDVNHLNIKKNVALSMVCQMGPAKMALKLLQENATVQQYNINGDTPVLLACRNGQTEVLELLLQYVDMEFVLFRAAIDGFDALFASVESDRPDCIRALHAYGVSLEERTSDDNSILKGATPLHLGAYYGRTQAVSVLLQLGANPNALDVNKMTPLHIAVIRKHAQIITLLVGKGADSQLRDSTGNTPAAYCRTQDPAMLNLLTDPVSKSLHTLCSLSTGQLAAERIDLKQVGELLDKHSAVPGLNSPREVIDSARDIKGRTPLTTAVIHNNYGLVEVLVAKGCVPDVLDHDGLNAHFFAQWIRNPRVLKALHTPTADLPETTRVRIASRTSKEASGILFLGDYGQFTTSSSSSSSSASASASADATNAGTAVVRASNESSVALRLSLWTAAFSVGGLRRGRVDDTKDEEEEKKDVGDKGNEKEKEKEGDGENVAIASIWDKKELINQTISTDLMQLFEKPSSASGKSKSSSQNQQQQQQQTQPLSISLQLRLVPPELMWEAKVATVTAIASEGESSSGSSSSALTAGGLFSLFLFTANPYVTEMVTLFMISEADTSAGSTSTSTTSPSSSSSNSGLSSSHPSGSLSPGLDPELHSAALLFAKSLWTILNRLNTFKGEVYASAKTIKLGGAGIGKGAGIGGGGSGSGIDRSTFTVGKLIVTKSFASGTTLWPVAVDSLPTVFKNEGTVFMIQSKTGKLVSMYSKFPSDCEVLFAPGSRFLVTHWYRGDVICLGQSNIRQHTFGLTQEQHAYYLSNTKPLIIELVEVDEGDSLDKMVKDIGNDMKDAPTEVTNKGSVHIKM